MFFVAKVKRQLQMFFVAKVKRQLQMSKYPSEMIQHWIFNVDYIAIF
ncbi:hypothetical protein [Lysinibacillus sp. G4S2]|nr:hypothetical protein [Lysinibacillus sp. G4S2]MDM5248648.1 hypothetical protein [Lysinibacillus sp. G4S2]